MHEKIKIKKISTLSLEKFVKVHSSGTEWRAIHWKRIIYSTVYRSTWSIRDLAVVQSPIVNVWSMIYVEWIWSLVETPDETFSYWKIILLTRRRKLYLRENLVKKFCCYRKELDYLSKNWKDLINAYDNLKTHRLDAF